MDCRVKPGMTSKVTCPGRDAAFFMPLRRTGTPVGVRKAGPRLCSAPLREELRAALRPGHETSKPGKPSLHRIVAAVEFAQVSQPAHGEAVGILLAGLEQFFDILGDLGARLGAGGGGLVHQKLIGLNDAVDGGVHGFLVGGHVDAKVLEVQKPETRWVASNCEIALLASRSLLNSPR